MKWLSSLRRHWCRLMHSRVSFAGGPTYECRVCLLRHENPMLHGPIKSLPQPCSVRQVETPAPARPKVRRIRGGQ
jgi:hypothetical protein